MLQNIHKLRYLIIIIKLTSLHLLPILIWKKVCEMRDRKGEKTSDKKQRIHNFLFGRLSTPEGRARRARLERQGFYHNAAISPPSPAPEQPITVVAFAGADINVTAVHLHYTTDGTRPDWQCTTNTIPLQKASSEWDTLVWGYAEKWSALIPGQSAGTHVQYIISARIAGGNIIFSPSSGCIPGSTALQRPPAVTNKQEVLSRQVRPQIYEFFIEPYKIPDWLREAVIYQAVPDRFSPQTGRNFLETDDLSSRLGGTLSGLTSKLDYLADLGVDCLWLTPIFNSPSYHGYDVCSYENIQHHLGTLADWEEFISQAHKHGIRILLDFVASHVSKEHPAFVCASNDKDSAAARWFHFTKWPDQYHCFLDISSMPKVDSDNEEARRYLIDAACAWIKRGCDGFRFDHAHGMSQSFWSHMRHSIKAIKSDSALIAEVTEPPDVLQSFAGRMDGCLDFAVAEAIRNFFGTHSITVSELDKAISQHYGYFNSTMLLPSFFDNHDMSRFLWLVKGNKRKLKLAALFQFTLPAPPIVYYGTEVGLSQKAPLVHLEEARLPMPWGSDQDQELLSFYRELVHARKNAINAWYAERKTHMVDDNAHLYAFSCADFLVVINNSSKERWMGSPAFHSAHMVVKSDECISLTPSTLTLTLEPYSGAILRLTPSSLPELQLAILK